MGSFMYVFCLSWMCWYSWLFPYFHHIILDDIVHLVSAGMESTHSHWSSYLVRYRHVTACHVWPFNVWRTLWILFHLSCSQICLNFIAFHDAGGYDSHLCVSPSERATSPDANICCFECECFKQFSWVATLSQVGDLGYLDIWHPLALFTSWARWPCHVMERVMILSFVKMVRHCHQWTNQGLLSVFDQRQLDVCLMTTRRRWAWRWSFQWCTRLWNRVLEMTT